MYRIGYGNDVHRLEENKTLILGGVKIENDLGAVGHSDADALAHAITDAILGALALGDIGSHFPDSDEKWKDADSFDFLREAVSLMKKKGFKSLISIRQLISKNRNFVRILIKCAKIWRVFWKRKSRIFRLKRKRAKKLMRLVNGGQFELKWSFCCPQFNFEVF